MTTWNTYDLPPTIFESDEYKDSYLDVVNESGKNYFLGIKLNSSNQVTNAYACGINNDIPFCIEGTSDGTNYRANETYLNSASLYNNTCIEYLDINTGYGYDYIECEPFDNSSLLTTLIYDGGDAVVRAEPGFNCAVSSNGYFVCNNPSGN